MSDENKGYISTIQLYSTKDGPGIRSTVFFMGCNLKCKWCSNPELLTPDIKYMHFEHKCIHCGACVEIASNHSITFAEKGCRIDRQMCSNLAECAEICPQNAYEKIGFEISSKELVHKIMRDKEFYSVSNGGVTFSGGDSILQGDFIIDVAQRLHAQGIHIALDTAGNICWEKMKAIIENVDMVLYDIKAYAGEIHKICTAVDNTLILSNIKHISKMNKDIIIRMIIVPGFNDDMDDVYQRIVFIKSLGPSVKRVDILEYHNLGSGKYARLGIENPIQQIISNNYSLLEKVKKMACELGLNAAILQ
jgi:pyruvate formate lyase activating enzyme